MASIFDFLNPVVDALKEAGEGLAASIGLAPKPRPALIENPDLSPTLTPAPAMGSPGLGLIPPGLHPANSNCVEGPAATAKLTSAPLYHIGQQLGMKFESLGITPSPCPPFAPQLTPKDKPENNPANTPSPSPQFEPPKHVSRPSPAPSF